jgi:precorrin-6Y C5,15-methyltransferase (decarboxylating)
MTKPWLDIIGIGADGLASLTPVKQKLLADAEIIITAQRIADLLVNASDAQIHIWPKPFDAMMDKLLTWKGKKILVIATGDPMWHGVGSIIARHLPADEFTVDPSPPAFSLAAARLGWPLSSVETLTLHGYSRPSELIIPFIQPKTRLISLTSGSKTVHEVAAHLVRLGYGQSIIHVLEDMGEATDNHITFAAQDIPDTPFSDFNTIAIQCTPDSDAPVLPRTPGLPDDAYEHDGQLTKRDVRAITLAALAPSPGQLLWDIGAGCGSIAIEWMRPHLWNRAIAFEAKANRAEMIARNAKALGTPYLQVVAGHAPETLKGQQQPDAVFIGGGMTVDGVFATAWQALKPGGKFVANAVTTQAIQFLYEKHHNLGGELVELSTSKLLPLGSKTVMRPALPVLQWRGTKP